MFVQVIEGPVADAGELKRALERWVETVQPGSTGWLGSTGGVAADGTGIGVVRFSSAEAARVNSARPEQHAWWMETSKVFTGEVKFHDCHEARSFLAGGSDEAGFVQIIQGRALDVDRLWEVNERVGPLLAKVRPDVLGGTVAVHEGGGFTQTVYFVSEEAARQGEARELPAELKALFEEEQSLIADATYLDLRDPWMYSPPS
jgi:hypothetical protein